MYGGNHTIMCFYSSWNSEFSQVYPQFSLQAINKLEILYCKELKWNLYISSSTYAKYYFALRSLTEKKDFRRYVLYTLDSIWHQSLYIGLYQSVLYVYIVCCIHSIKHHPWYVMFDIIHKVLQM